MNLNYKLSNLDFLEYQLYTSSKSKLHKKKRFRSRIIVPIIYLLLGLYTVNKNQDNRIGIIFVAIAVIWFLFYPMYSKWRYKKHFQKHVKENYKNRIDKQVSIDFDKKSMNVKDFTSESKINGTELKELIETKNHYFIKLTTDLSLIIPKEAVTDKLEFKKRITDFGAEYIDELNWEWK